MSRLERVCRDVISWRPYGMTKKIPDSAASHHIFAIFAFWIIFIWMVCNRLNERVLFFIIRKYKEIGDEKDS